MPEDANLRDHWPRFELVTFSSPTGIPNGWDVELVSKGIPKSLLGRYEAASRLTLIEVPQDGQVVRFGSIGLYGSMCREPRTGQVVHVNTLPDRVLAPAYFVNSSLDSFLASVRAVIERFPFDREDTGVDRVPDGTVDEWAHGEALADDWDQAAAELTETLRRIDPPAVADQDGFWKVFIGDVQMGNYATTEILGESGA